MRSVRTLMQGMIDYAGLFPPAKLEMGPTVSNYARALQGEDRDMLARLVLPVSRIEDFETEAVNHLPRGEDDEPWLITALTVSADDENLPADMEAIVKFNDDHSEPENGLALIDTIELRATTSREIDAAIHEIPDGVRAFFELPWQAGDLRGVMAAVAGEDLGAKVRTGGMEPELFPPPEALARFIHACATANVPFKATAGLHHPLRHFNEGQQVRMHGFVNVTLAAALAGKRGVTVEELAELLAEEDPAAFEFTPEMIRWRAHEVGEERIEATRERLFVSIGSCSFDEPREDLRAMGLL